MSPVILICPLPMTFRFYTCLLSNCPESSLGAITHLLCELFILLVLIRRSFLYHLPLNTSSSPAPPNSQNCLRTEQWKRGLRPSWELGFSSECFNEASSSLPQIPVVGLLGTLPGPATTSGRQLFQRAPGKIKGMVGFSQNLEIVFKLTRRQCKVCSGSPTPETSQVP